MSNATNNLFELTDTQLDLQIAESCKELASLERDTPAFDAACEYRAELSAERRARRAEAKQELAGQWL